MNDLVLDKQTTISAMKQKNAKRGRPRTSLLKTIKHDLKAHKLKIEQAVELPQNKDIWKLEGSHTPVNEEL